jgi:hypothetical protein
MAQNQHQDPTGEFFMQFIQGSELIFLHRANKTFNLKSEKKHNTLKIKRLTTLDLSI